MKNARAITLISTAAVLATAAPALAGPFDPAYRGAPNSVHAIFDWVSNNQAAWDTTLFETGPSDFPLHPTIPQASDDGLTTLVLLPNFIDPLPLKDMRLQLSFDGTVPLDEIDVLVNAFDPETTTVIETGRGEDVTGLPTYFIDFQIRPNPDWEEIFIFGDVPNNIVPGNLLRIEIDTVSFPTPGAISVAALAGLATLRRRRR